MARRKGLSAEWGSAGARRRGLSAEWGSAGARRRRLSADRGSAGAISGPPQMKSSEELDGSLQEPKGDQR